MNCAEYNGEFAIDWAKDKIQDEEVTASEQQHKPSISKMTESLSRARATTRQDADGHVSKRCAQGILAARIPKSGALEAVRVERRQRQSSSEETGLRSDTTFFKASRWGYSRAATGRGAGRA